MPNGSDLRERAKRVGEASGFVHHEEHHGSYGLNQEFEYLCTRCAIERAALEELRAAVAEEREACALAVNELRFEQRAETDLRSIAAMLRARGQR